MEDVLSKLYQKLQNDYQDNFTVDFNTFKKDMSDPEKRYRLYNTMRSDYGNNFQKTFEEFSNDIGFPVPSPIQPKPYKNEPYNLIGKELSKETPLTKQDIQNLSFSQRELTDLPSEYGNNLDNNLNVELANSATAENPLTIGKKQKNVVQKYIQSPEYEKATMPQRASVLMDLINENKDNEVIKEYYSDKEYMNNLFSMMPPEKQRELYEKEPDRWKDAALSTGVVSPGDVQRAGKKGIGWDLLYGGQDMLEALNTGVSNLITGLAELEHQKIEKPIFGWLGKAITGKEDDRLIWGRIADYFAEDAQTSASRSHYNIIDKEGKIKEADFVDYAKKGQIGKLVNDLIVNGLETMPLSAAVIGLSAAGQPEAGYLLMYANSYGLNKRNLDKNHPELPEWKKEIIAQSNAVIDAASERIGDIPIGKWLGSLYKNAGKQAFDMAAGTTANEIVKNTTKNLKGSVAKNFGKAFILEDIEELVAAEGQWAVEKLGGIENKSFLQAQPDVFKQGTYGGVGGLGFGALGVKGQRINNKIAQKVETLQQEYDEKSKVLKDVLKDTDFKFEGEKFLSLPPEAQKKTLGYIISSDNLNDEQKQAIVDYVSIGNEYNAALANIGLSNIEKLQKQAAVIKDINEKANETTGNIDKVVLNTEVEDKVFEVAKGKIATDKNGNIDKLRSSQAIYYRTGEVNEDGSPEIKIASIEDIADFQSEDSKALLQSAMNEIELQELGKMNFGNGAVIAYTDENGNPIKDENGNALQFVVKETTDKGIVIDTGFGETVEIPYEVAAENFDVVEEEEKTPEEQQPEEQQQSVQPEQQPEELNPEGKPYYKGQKRVYSDGSVFQITNENEDGTYNAEFYNKKTSEVNKLEDLTQEELQSMYDLQPEIQTTKTYEQQQEQVQGQPETQQEEQLLSPEEQERKEMQNFMESLPKIQNGKNAGQIDQSRMSPEQTIRYFEYTFGKDKTILAADKQIKNLQAQLKKEQEKLDKDPFNIEQNKRVSDIENQIAVYSDYIKKAKIQRLEDTINEREKFVSEQQNNEKENKQPEGETVSQENNQETINRENLENVPDVLMDIPKNARLRGFRVQNGVRIDRQQPYPITSFTEQKRKFSEKETIPVKRTIVEAENVQPSHINGVRNMQYFITEAQPKERIDKASILSAEKIAQNINPDEITKGVTAYTGAPIVNNRLETIQGNNRIIGLQNMYNNFQKNAEKYKQYLIEHAKDYGMTPEQIQSMKHPVAVDVADVNDDDAIRLGQLNAADTESGGYQRISPQQVAVGLGENLANFSQILLIDNSENEVSLSELVGENGDRAIKYLASKGLINSTQIQSAYDKYGNITPEAKKDLIDIASYMLFNGAGANLQRMFNLLPDKAQKAILQTIYRDFKSDPQDRILEDIRDGIEAYYILSQNSDFASATKIKDARGIAEFMKNQIVMFNNETRLPLQKYSNFAMELAIMFKTYSQKQLVSTFNSLYDSLQGVGGDIFNKTEKLSLIDAIKKHFNLENYVPIRQNERNTVAQQNDRSREREQEVLGTPESGERNTKGEQPTERGGRTEPNNGIREEETKSEVEKAIDELQSRTNNNTNVVFVESGNELPEFIRKSKEYNEKTFDAVFDGNNTIYLNRNKIKTADEAIRIWVHEIGIHKGIRGIITDETEQNNLFERIYDSIENLSKTNSDIKSIFDKVKSLYNNSSKAVQGEEMLAYIAEKRFGEEQLTEVEQTLWDEIVKLFRNAIEKVIGSKELLSDSEINDIIKASVRSQIQVQADDLEMNNESLQQETFTGDIAEYAKKISEKNKKQEKIEDFGEKIGGAKKDLGITRTVRDEDSLPAWRRKYKIHILPNTKDKNVEENNKFIAITYNTNNKQFWVLKKYDSIIYNKPIEGNPYAIKTFESEKEAEDFIPIYEAYEQGFRIRKTKDGEWQIVKSSSTGKILEFDKFNTEEEARTFLFSTEGATSLLNRKREKFSIPALEKVERTGKDWRKGKDITPEEFVNTFKFRGVEFGNWVKHEERQALLNIAYDSFMDLSDILNVSPEALSLNGNLAISFGSRGISDALAHYEPLRAVINMTRLNGAGSLAHEWAHALDNYFGLQERNATYEKDQEGKLKAGRAFKTELKGRYIGMRQELSAIFDEIVRLMIEKPVSQEKNVMIAQSKLEKYKNLANREADRIIKLFENGQVRYFKNRTTGKYEEKRLKANDEQLSEIKKIIENLLSSEEEIKMLINFKNSSITYENDNIIRLNEIFKNVFGYRGIKKDGGELYDFINYLKEVNRLKEALNRAEKGTSETAKEKTDYLKRSEEFDKTRAGRYWSSPVEMFARAFENYVVSKLKNKNIKSDYLQYDKATVYQQMYDKNPYPSGEEAEILNNLFDQFFDTVQEKVDEETGNIALFRKTYKDVQDLKDNLVVLHNIYQDKLIRADKLGGLAVPSIAITDVNNAFTDYGDITLIGDKNIIDPLNKSNKVFDSDIYSPTYPRIETIIKDDKPIIDFVKNLPEEMQNQAKDKIKSEIEERGVEGLYDDAKLKYQFLKDKGIDVLSKDESGKIDSWETERNARYYIENNNLVNEFKDYADNFFDKIKQEQRIFKGFTPSGNRRYAENTIQNIVNEIKSQGLRGGEGFLYGSGVTRANISKQFKSLNEIDKNRNKIVSKEQFDKIKDEIENEYEKILDEIRPFYKYSTNDFEAFASELPKLANKGYSESYNKLSDEVRKDVIEFAEKLKNLPTQYFEAKPQRAVAINEFSGAVIPSDARNKVKEILVKNGIPYKEYNNEIERIKAVKDMTAELGVRFRKSTENMPNEELEQPPYNGEPIDEYAKKVDEYNKSIRFKFVEPDMPEVPKISSDMPVYQIAERVSKFNEEYRTTLKDVDREMKKGLGFMQAAIDRAYPLEKYLEEMVKHGAVLRSETNAYEDHITSISRSTYFIEKFKKECIHPLQNILKEIIQSGKLNDLPEYRWNVMDAFGEIVNNKKISNYDRISIYLQAKDIIEAEDLGLEERGREGFTKNVFSENGEIGITPEEYILEFENAVGEETISKIWDKVRKSTKWPLDFLLENGRIDKKTYDKYVDERRKFYVPQRGWRTRDLLNDKLFYTVDEIDTPNSPYNTVWEKSEGRKSLSSDPLAYIQSIGETTVLICMKNNTKRTFLKFARENEDLARKYNFFTFKQVYYVKQYNKDGTPQRYAEEEDKALAGKIKYSRTTIPPTDEQIEHDKEIRNEIDKVIKKRNNLISKESVRLAILSIQSGKPENASNEFKEKIKQLFEEEEQLREKLEVLFTASEASIPIERTKAEAKEHEVTVIEDGKEVVIVFGTDSKGNAVYAGESVANVLNRKFPHEHETDNDILIYTENIIRQGTRFMSGMMTRYNPTFAAANLVRDVGIASIGNIAQFGINYQIEFTRNLATPKLQAAIWDYVYNDLYFSEGKFTNNYYGKLLMEFFEDGSATGWSFLKDIDQLREDMRKAIDPSKIQQLLKSNANPLLFLKHTFGMLTEVSELQTRFAEYVTSREQKNSDGTNKYSRRECAMHAKEATVNFDRKGNFGRATGLLFAFFNASVQGTNKIIRMCRDERVRNAMIVVMGSFFALGLLQAFFMPTGDDDERAFTEWELMNNLCIKKVKIPLPQVLRAFWGLGTQAGLAMKGNKAINAAILDGANYFLGNVLPDQLTAFLNILEIDDKTGEIKPFGDKAMKLTLHSISPTIIQPLVDIFANIKFTGSSVYNTEYTSAQFGTKAQRTLGKKNVPTPYQMFADWMWQLGGGSLKTTTKGRADDITKDVGWFFDINPSKIQTFVEGYSAGTGKFITDMIGLAIDVFDPNKKVNFSQMQIANVFLKQPKDFDPAQKVYYDLRARAEYMDQKFNDLRINDPDRYIKIITSTPDTSKERKAYDLVQQYKILVKIKDAIEMINNTKGISEERKMEELENIKKQTGFEDESDILLKAQQLLKEFERL